jgi:acetyl esterase/lipase
MILTATHLLHRFPSFALKAAILTYGDFAPAGLPAIYNSRSTPFLDQDFRSEYLSCYFPGRDARSLQQPDVAPMYIDLEELRGRLPKSLFLCGSHDLLLDDSVMMCVKWLQAGAEGILRVVPGGFHRFLGFPIEEVPVAREGWDSIFEFLAEID